MKNKTEKVMCIGGSFKYVGKIKKNSKPSVSYEDFVRDENGNLILNNNK